MVALWQILGFQGNVPATWAEASEKCEALGMGSVCLTNEKHHARWVIDCGEAGARLRVVVKESISSFSSLPAHSPHSVGHCYTLRPAPVTDQGGIDSRWSDEIAPNWADAWSSGKLSPLQELLVPRIAGGLCMMDAARTPAQAVEAVLHAPLDQVSSFASGTLLHTSVGACLLI